MTVAGLLEYFLSHSQHVKGRAFLGNILVFEIYQELLAFGTWTLLKE